MTTQATLSMDATSVETTAPRAATAPAPRGTVRAGLLSVADQAFISAASFLSTIILGRYASPEQLGIFYLAFQTVSFARQFQSRLVSAPYSVHYHRLAENERDFFTGSALIHQLLIAIGTALVLTANLWVHVFSSAPGPFIDAGLMLIIACPLMMLHDHLRQTMFVHREMWLTLMISIGLLVVHSLALTFLVQRDAVVASSVLGVLAITHGVACGVWYFARSTSFQFRWTSIRPDWLLNWTFAKWALVSKLIGECSPFVVPLIVTAQLGAKDTAVVAACGGLVGTANVFVSGIGRFLGANAPRVYAESGSRPLCLLLFQTAALFAIVIGSLNLTLFFFAEPILELLYGGNYNTASHMVFVMSLAVLVNSLSVVVGGGIWAVSCPRANIPADIVTTLVTIGGVIAMLPIYGVLGAAYGMVLGASAGTIVRVCSFIVTLNTAETPKAGGTHE
ncbi:MAG: O-antigen/teichoic acid export membrane protein [Pirellulaceae bacterium]|jgi:O-antigen/teichoic acid export membrane protein